MQFAPIVPRDLIWKFCGMSKYQMCLAQFAMRDKVYAKLYASMVASGHMVILDNGAYEGQTLSPQLLMKVVDFVRPTVLVLPDKPGDREATDKLSAEFAKEIRGVFALRGIELMKVLHPAPTDQLRDSQEYYKEIAAEFKWVGLSKLTKSYAHDMPVGRSSFLQNTAINSKVSKDTQHHALGFHGEYRWDQMLEELRCLEIAGFVGVDSSVPIWRGLHGASICQDRPESMPNFSPELDYQPWPEQLNLAEHNLKEVLRICKSPLEV